MKILVTGANGYIGSKVVSRLIDMGNDVTAVDFSNAHVDPRARYVQANIFAEEDFPLFFDNPDVCLHLAWKDGFIHSSFEHINNLSDHFRFVERLIARGVKQIAVMGSAHEIGYFEGAVDAETPTNPQSLYGIAKDALRRSLIVLCREKNVILQWLRAFYIYGDDEYGSSIFCKLRKADKEGKKLFPFTTGKNKFDFLSIDELAKQICLTITQRKYTGVINICSGEPVSLGEKVEWYIRQNHLNISLQYGVFPEKPTESPCLYGNPETIRAIQDQKKQKIVITGGKGQVAYDCVKTLRCRGYENILPIDIEDLDLTDEAAVNAFVLKERPYAIIHCAAWTAVDKAEQYPEKVREINAFGSKYLAEACNKTGTKLAYLSTDYVFDGTGETPFEVDSPKKGLSVYGLTKSQGEDFIMAAMKRYFIVRISWAFGINGNNFISTMLRLRKTGKETLTVVSDQVGSITYAPDLARLLVDMIETDKYGVYHATNEGFVGRAELARAIFKEAGLPTVVNDITTAEYNELVPAQADRPLNSRLSKKSLDEAGFLRLPAWQDALHRYIQELKNKEKGE